VVDEQLADQLLAKAEAEGVELLGPQGLLSQVTKAVLERALAEEMTEHNAARLPSVTDADELVGLWTAGRTLTARRNRASWPCSTTAPDGAPGAGSAAAWSSSG